MTQRWQYSTRLRSIVATGWIRFVRILACALAFACTVQPAAAADDSPIRLRLGNTFASDQNVFRVSDGAADPKLAQGQAGKSDHYTQSYYGVDLDKTFSSQHFIAGFTKTATRYYEFDQLDRNSFDWNEEVQWSVGSRLTGVLHRDHAESTVGFEEVAGTTLNTRTTDKNIGTIDYLVGSGWHARAGYYNTIIATSTALLTQPPSSVDTGEVGFLYAPGGNKNTLSIYRRLLRAGVATATGAPDLVNLIDSHYQENELEVSATWAPTDSSTLNGRLTHYERRNQVIVARDYSRAGGELGYVWTPISKLTLKFTATRNITAWTPDVSTSFKNDDIYTIAPTWQFTDKIKATLNPVFTVTDYLGAVAPFTGPARRDIMRSITLTGDWKIHRYMTLVATLQRQHRSSTQTNFEYKDTIATMAMQIKF